LAVGAISCVPLGDEVRGGTPKDLAQEAEAILEIRDSKFSFRELPVQISVAGHSRVMFRGREQLEGYDLWVSMDSAPAFPVSMNALRFH
jgi:hypothetical protein